MEGYTKKSKVDSFKSPSLQAFNHIHDLFNQRLTGMALYSYPDDVERPVLCTLSFNHHWNVDVCYNMDQSRCWLEVRHGRTKASRLHPHALTDAGQRFFGNRQLDSVTGMWYGLALQTYTLSHVYSVVLEKHKCGERSVVHPDVVIDLWGKLQN